MSDSGLQLKSNTSSLTSPFKRVRPKTSTETSTWRERFARHETIFDQGRTFTPPELWHRLESLKELKAERSKWLSERRHIARGVKEARMEEREIADKLLEGRETKENLAKHEKIVKMLEACWNSAEAHLKYCEDCIEHHEKREARRAKKQAAKQKKKDVTEDSTKEEAQVAEGEEEYFTAEE